MAVSGIPIGRFLNQLEPLLASLSLGVREVHRPALRSVLLGLLRLPSPFVSDIARGLGEEFGPSLDAREHRLVRFLGSPKLSLERLKSALRRLVAGMLPRQGRVYLYGDLSDLAKPHARSMQGLDWVRDGSDPEERIVRGYWLNEVYVELDHGRFVPVVFELYSLRSGETLSQTNVLLRGMDEAFQVAGPLGVYVADRGMDAGDLFADLLHHSRDFIIRLKTGTNSRCLLLEGDRLVTVSDLLRSFPLPEMLYDDAILRKVGWMGWRKVRLPEHPDRELTLVVAHMQGQDHPLVLLTTLPVLQPRVASHIVAVYLRRWNADEDSIRFIKQAFRLEKYLLARLRRMQTWVFLIGAATALLGLLQAHRSAGHGMARNFPSFKKRVRTLYYRIARAVSELLLSLSPARYRALARGP